MKGKTIYITQDEFAAINEATDTLAGNVQGAEQEYIDNTLPTISKLYNVIKKFQGFSKQERFKRSKQ